MNKYILEKLNECRVCSGKLTVVENIKNIPINGMELLNQPIVPTCLDFDLLRCSMCGHYQIPNIENFRYANDWKNSSNLDVLLDTWKNFIKYLSSIAPSHEKAFEILGGTKIIGESEKYFKQVVRQPLEALVCGDKKEEAHTAIYNHVESHIQKDIFDAFYLYDTLAHIENVTQVLKDVFEILKENGVGWIEVPNGLTIINECQYYSILPEHINYFTPHSLSTLVHSAGFQTLSIQPSLGGHHLDVFFKKPKTNLSIIKNMKKWFDVILDEISNHSNVVIWGAGAKAHQIFGYLSDKLKVSHIVDSGSHKCGLFIPGANVSIEAPSKEIFIDADLVIIFAVSFEKEITVILREEYHYNGKILSLSNRLS